MINQTTSCDNCIHNKVCGIKSNVSGTTDRANDIFKEYMYPNVDIFIRCHHYQKGSDSIKRSAGFD